MNRGTTKKPAAKRGAPARAKPAVGRAAAVPKSDFYSPDDDAGGVTARTAPESALAQHAAGVRRQSVDMEDGRSADATLSEHANDAAPDLQSEVERIRKIRKPLGAVSQKLAIASRRGYHRHWFNDAPGRIAEAASNGWTHVKTEDGQPMKRVVGAGRDNGALHAYAMELPEVFWQEDMAARHAVAQEKVEALKASPFRAAPGTAKPSDGGKFYSPQEETGGALTVVKG